MKRFITILIVFAFSGSLVFSQWDARQTPYYISAESITDVPIFAKHHAYIRGDVPLNNTKWKIPDKMLTENGFKLINISGNQGSQDETWITINPSNPLNIVGSSNNIRYNHGGVGYKMSGYYTLDGGKTWAVSTTPSNINKYISAPSNGSMTNFDPTQAFDTKGNLLLAYGFAQVGNSNDEFDNGVFINRSTDGGKTWSEPIPIVTETQGTADQPFHDRYTLTCDVSPTSKYKDKYYIAWQRFKKNPGVLVSYSTNAGDDWSNAQTMIGSGYDTQAPMPVTGPNGEVYVAWRQAVAGDQSTDLEIQKSLDGGKTWLSNPVKIMNVRNLGTVNSQSGRNVLAEKQNIRISSCPYITVDLSNGPRRGWIYCVTAGKDAQSKTHIFLSKSTNNGVAWSAPQVIDNNTLGNDCIFPSISVDPITGLVAVFYYSSQNDPKNVGLDAYLAVSFDGSSFNQYRLSPTTWYLNSGYTISYQGPGNYYWGDYSGITAYNGKIYPCFWMPSSSGGDYSSVLAYSADISIAPLPPSNLTFINKSAEPTKVILNWNDPILNNLGGALTDFKIAVYKDNTLLGEVNKGVQTYTDNTALEGQTFTYNLKTITTDKLESPFISISGIAGGSSEANPPTEISSKPSAAGFDLSWKNPSKHVDNSDINDLDRIDIYNGATLVKSVTGGNIQSGSVSTQSLTLPTEKFYNINLVAVTKRGTKETTSKSSDTLLVYSGAPLTTLGENFDGTKTIPMYLKGTIQWALTTKAANSKPNSWTDSPDGKYSNNATSYTIFAPVTIAADKKTLSFQHIAIIEAGDNGIVSVSEDLKTWKDIAYFDKTRSTDWTDDVTTSQWYSEHRTLADYEGKTIYLKFTITSNYFKNNDGWYIDDLQIDDNINSVNELANIDNNLKVELYPNPVSQNLSLNLTMANPMELTADIYDILGNKVMSLINGIYDAGSLKNDFNVSELSVGAYYIKFNSNGAVKTQNLLINR